MDLATQIFHRFHSASDSLYSWIDAGSAKGASKETHVVFGAFEHRKGSRTIR